MRAAIDATIDGGVDHDVTRGVAKQIVEFRSAGD
jgi:hypothetical protein